VSRVIPLVGMHRWLSEVRRPHWKAPPRSSTMRRRLSTAKTTLHPAYASDVGKTLDSTVAIRRPQQCWRKCSRSMRSSPIGGRPLPAFGVERRDQGAEFTPRHHLVHFGQELRTTGLLAMLVEACARQGQLPHLTQLRRCRYTPTDRSVTVSRKTCSEVP
jgi:hypothetical protein